MPDIQLERLRNLRRRAEVLLSTLVSDLKPFSHETEVNGFVRRPDSVSDPDDVNVTTTCSCLMALALTDKLGDFYSDKNKGIPAAIFSNLLAAPWMSSGLTENNAFTTTLVLRTFGFLVQNSLGIADKADAKRWELSLGIHDVRGLASKLTAIKKDKVSDLLFSLIPRSTQKEIKSFLSSGGGEERMKARINAELAKIINTTALYEENRFKDVKLSDATKEFLGKSLDGYSVAQFNRLLIHDAYPGEIEPLKTKSLASVAEAMSEEPANFAINQYPPTAAVIYWFVDGVTRAKIRLEKENWSEICAWATREFARQRSLVAAKHAAMMDPVAMAMAACLCARLRAITNNAELGTNKEHHAKLPSLTELEHAIIELFGEQTKSGIWPKYFPLFHYQEAGSNFCFTFELLEAVLSEFGHKHNSLVGDTSFVDGLERAVGWCEKHRLQCSETKGTGVIAYQGWNSGGFFETLQKGQPESWATAVVHMFLWELVDVLSRHIQERLLETYKASFPSAKWKKIDQLLDIQLWLEGQHKGLKQTLSKTIIRSFKDETAASLRKRPKKKVPLSALLFGPPGTSKTEITKAVAAELRWPLIEIDPSHFLQSSFQNIYVQAERIFEDMMDLSGVVVLFDEMDALVQKRDGEPQFEIDTESKFLTTYMLPKLAKLHDRGRVVFFMATNFQAKFDDAIKRAGRFDFLLCMGPPMLRAKCDGVHIFYDDEEPTANTKDAGTKIWAHCEADKWTKEQLELYTFGDFKTFLSGISEDKDLLATSITGDVAAFKNQVREDSKSATLRFDDLTVILENMKKKAVFELDEVEFDAGVLRKMGVDIARPTVKYVLDRKQSRRQCPKLLDEDK